jgi:hypothetical protein
MFGEQHTRTLLGPADPVRTSAVAPPRLSAHDLIVLAEAAPEPVGGRRAARPTRRLVLAAGAAVALAAAGTVAYTAGQPGGPEAPNADAPPVTGQPEGNLGQVLVPIAYQVTDSAGPAGAELRALAGRLEDAPYEDSTGRYTYHADKSWGSPVISAENNRYVLGTVSETKVWQAADGTTQQVRADLEPEFPDEESRDYWTRHPLKTTEKSPKSGPEPLPPSVLAPPPSDRAGLTDLLEVEFGAGAASKATMTLYARYVVPRQTRAEVLRVLADVPGFLWRGEVTDRAGRKGVAITFDDREHGQQHLLIFSPKTGDLLAEELLTLAPKRISSYKMILDTGRTDTIG